MPPKQGITVGALSSATTSEDGTTSTFTVVLTVKPTADVTIPLSVDKPTEASLSASSLTFTPANYATPQTVTITGLNDDVDDGDIAYKVTFGASTSTDTGSNGITPAALSLTNIDNDTAGLLVSAPSSATTTEKGGTSTFKVRLKTKPTADVTIPVVSDTVAEGTVDKASLTFTAANYNVEQTVTVTGVNDLEPDGDKPYKIALGKSTSTDVLYKDLEANVQLTNLDDDAVAQLAGGNSYMCARFVDGGVKCWGSNGSGTLGLGDTAARGDAPNEMGANLPFINLGTGRTAKLLADATRPNGHMCAILDDNSVKCWGENNLGQLGLGNTVARGDQANEMGDNLPAVDLGAGRTAKALAIGFRHSCAILDDNSVKCWGDNGFGQLGQGNTAARGDGANEMGANLPAIDLGAGRTAKAIGAGTYHTCAILDDNTIKCWGYNNEGQLGYGDQTYRGDGPNEMGAALAAVNLGAGLTAKSLSVGGYHTCAILSNDALKCWGYNGEGALGLGNNANRGDQANEMGDNLPAVNVGAGLKATKVYASHLETCAILDNGATKCWGNNGNGQSGYGDTSFRGDAANEMGDNLLGVNFGAGRTAIALGASYYGACAILDNKKIKCWGAGTNGQLGYGDTTQRGSGANQMGDNLPFVILK